MRGILKSYPVPGIEVSIWGVVWFQWKGCGESFQDTVDISWYGNINVLQLVIIFQDKSTV